MNRIDSDDDDDDEPEERPKEKKASEKADEESKGTSVSTPPAGGQSQAKAAVAPSLASNPEPTKNTGAAPAAAVAPNGPVGQEMAAQDDDEDDLLGVTDLVDYVCNNEDL